MLNCLIDCNYYKMVEIGIHRNNRFKRVNQFTGIKNSIVVSNCLKVSITKLVIIYHNCTERLSIMDSNLPLQLPSSYEERMLLLKYILKGAFEKLGNESKERKVLVPPYGRPIPPTPLLTEEELIKRGGFSSNPMDDVPIFTYDYGFNPLVYLGNLIKWAHPESVFERNDSVKKSHQRLIFRAKHAQQQLKTALTLKQSFSKLNSGLNWGPFITPSLTNKTEVVCVVKPIRDGDLVVQLSRTADFKYIEIEIVKPIMQFYIPTKLVIPKLDLGVHYYIRCCMKDRNYEDPNYPLKPVVEAETVVEQKGFRKLDKAEEERRKQIEKEQMEQKEKLEQELSKLPPHLRPSARFTGMEANYYQYGEFWTLLSEEINETDEMIDEVNMKLIDDGAEELLLVDPFVLCCVGVSSVIHSQSVEGTVEDVVTNNANTNRKRTLIKNNNAVVAKLRNMYPDCRYRTSSNPLDMNCEYTPQLTDLLIQTLQFRSKYNKENPKKIPVYSSLIGDIFNSAVLAADDNVTSSGLTLLNDSLFKLSIHSGVFANTLSIFRKSGFFIGWNDGAVGSKSGLRAEEVLYKQFSHELRKHQRKYKVPTDKKGNPIVSKDPSAGQAPPAPVLQRPPPSSSLETLLNVSTSILCYMSCILYAIVLLSVMKYLHMYLDLTISSYIYTFSNGFSL